MSIKPYNVWYVQRTRDKFFSLIPFHNYSVTL